MSHPGSARSPITRFVLVALAALAAALIVPGASVAAPTDAAPSAPVRHDGHHQRPTIVLVHGAWADGSSWAGVITRLQREGYTVLAPPNPLRSLSGDSSYIKDFLSTIKGPIVLVGHSYGGAVITNAATGNPNVKALVYVDGFAPDQGEIVNNLIGAGSALAVDPATVFDVRPYPGAPAGDADLYLKPEVVANSFAQDLPRRESALLAATQRPLTIAAGNDPSGVPAWRTIPSWYLVGTRDKIITPKSQLMMARRAGSHIVKIRSSHVSLISHPRAVTRLITVAAHAHAR
jgi:pimeloyl-ACP methyl ester carboxylesterase